MRFLKVFFLLVFLNSCEGEGLKDFETTPLSGNWELVAVNCYCRFPLEVDFNKTKILFVAGKKELVVMQEANENFFAAAGTYKYNYVDKVFSINSVDKEFEVVLEEGSLTITSIEDPRVADASVQYVFKAL